MNDIPTPRGDCQGCNLPMLVARQSAEYETILRTLESLKALIEPVARSSEAIGHLENEVGHLRDDNKALWKNVSKLESDVFAEQSISKKKEWDRYMIATWIGIVLSFLGGAIISPLLQKFL